MFITSVLLVLVCTSLGHIFINSRDIDSMPRLAVGVKKDLIDTLERDITCFW